MTLSVELIFDKFFFFLSALEPKAIQVLPVYLFESIQF